MNNHSDADNFEDEIERQLAKFDEVVTTESACVDILAQKRKDFMVGLNEKVNNIIMPTMEKAAARSTDTVKISCSSNQFTALMSLLVKTTGRPKQCQLTYRADDKSNRVVVKMEEEGRSLHGLVEEPEFLILADITVPRVAAHILKLIELGRKIRLGS